MSNLRVHDVTRAALCAVALLGLISWSACKSDSGDNVQHDAGRSTALGLAGESCQRRADCKSGLSCVRNVCAPMLTTVDAGSESSAAVGGDVGESCTASADCKAALACIDNRCVDKTVTDAGVAPEKSQRGSEGESCASRLDCLDGLACLNGSCRADEVHFETLPKKCYAIQCSATADCCDGYPLTTPSCLQYKQDCTDGIVNSCAFYKQTCECTQVCKDSLCVLDDSCDSDLDCTNGLNPYCVSSACVTCRDKNDCFGVDQDCVNHACIAPCKHDEECPFSNGLAGTPITITQCKAGECIERKCVSDRECYFASQNSMAKCNPQGECQLPCVHDSDCSATFNVCRDGLCTFVGCQTNEECRLALGLGQPGTSTTAECK